MHSPEGNPGYPYFSGSESGPYTDPYFFMQGQTMRIGRSKKDPRENVIALWGLGPLENSGNIGYGEVIRFVRKDDCSEEAGRFHDWLLLNVGKKIEVIRETVESATPRERVTLSITQEGGQEETYTVDNLIGHFR